MNSKDTQFNKHLLNIYNGKEKNESSMVHSFMEEIIFHWEKLSKQNEGQVEFMKAVNKIGRGDRTFQGDKRAMIKDLDILKSNEKLSSLI